MVIWPGFVTLSYQHVAHAQKSFNSIHAESFPEKIEQETKLCRQGEVLVILK